MKSKLKFFGAGFGAGLLAAFLWIGLAPDRPRDPRVGAIWMPEASTNLNIRMLWKAASVTFSYDEPRKSKPTNSSVQ
jgi:hypothetical protein